MTKLVLCHNRFLLIYLIKPQIQVYLNMLWSVGSIYHYWWNPFSMLGTIPIWYHLNFSRIFKICGVVFGPFSKQSFIDKSFLADLSNTILSFMADFSSRKTAWCSKKWHSDDCSCGETLSMIPSLICLLKASSYSLIVLHDIKKFYVRYIIYHISR